MDRPADQALPGGGRAPGFLLSLASLGLKCEGHGGKSCEACRIQEAVAISDGWSVELEHCPHRGNWEFEKFCLSAYRRAKEGNPLWPAGQEPCWARQAFNVLGAVEADLMEAEAKRRQDARGEH